ncbi:MAG: SRPBCC family protein [Nitrososphaerota archaeon]|nr:SRPBCC family protein [Nitrososphaerota archaeon]MDG7023615.1 SRPBCC family protein [Nitrososphaerota archaeon]
MQLQGKFPLPTTVDKAWAYVSDPAKVIECVPGLQTYTVGENKRISATVQVSIGFIRGTFQTNTKVVREDPSTHAASLELAGTGAGSGFNAAVNIAVAAVGGTSELAWDANVNISGPLGGLAKPLIEGNVKKIISQLFDCVKAKLSQAP